MKGQLGLFSSPLAKRISLAVFIVSISVTAITSSIFLYSQLQTELKNINTQLDEIKDSHLAGIGARVWVADLESLQLDLSGLLSLSAIEYLAVLENGQVLIEAGERPQGETIIRHHPISYFYKGEHLEIGQLTVVASTAYAYNKLYAEASFIILMIAFQTFAVAGLVLLLFNRGITQHLRTISAFARQLELANIDQELDLQRTNASARSPDELDILVEAISTMQRQLSQSVTALAESEENLALTLNCIGDGVIVTDDQGEITRMNPVAEQLTGWTSADAQGQPIAEVFNIVHANTREAVVSPIYRAIKSAGTASLSSHTSLLARNGQAFHIADSAAPILNKGTVIGAILVFHDISEQYEMRQVLRDNEKRLKQHIDQTPLGVIEWNRDFEVISWNPAATKIFGFSQKEALGRRASELLITPSGITESIENWQALLDKPKVSQQRQCNINKAGEVRVCEWFNTPLSDENGRVTRVASLVDDVTQRVQAEGIQHQQQEEQKQLLDNMLDAVISIDEDGSILSFNPSAVSLFGYSADEIIGRDFTLLIPDDSTRAGINTLNHHVSKTYTSNRTYETWAINKKGETFPVRLSLAPLPTINQGKRRFIISLHDLSLEKKTEEQLRRSQKMDALGKLTGGIAHDYNNMLGIVLGYAELLHAGLVKTGQTNFLGYVDSISQAGERGAALTKKLLSFSRQLPVEASPQDLNSLLANQQPMLEKTLTARISFNTTLQADLWQVWIDRGDFDDALLNLCINAMHAMTSTGTLSIETSNRQLNNADGQALGLVAGDYVCLSVSDTGSGMDNETLTRIFDPFFSTKGERGTGLGLSQVYAFVERSQGAVQAHSTVNIGTRFDLYFPRYAGGIQINSSESSNDTLLFQGNETILIVDDEPNLLSLASNILSQQGYRVLSASSGEEALIQLRTQHVDLMFSDIIMPKMDGFQLTALVKKDFPKVKIQLTSGFNDSHQTADFDLALQQTMLSKPYNSHTLLERIRNLLDETQE